MICSACNFETARLLVKEWHLLADHDWHRQDLADLVARVLTERVTRSLPPSWQGQYTPARAREWIAERDDAGATLLVIEKSTGEGIGLMILSETATRSGHDVRLGYLLAEPWWGQGLASELVGGIVGWSRAQPGISSLVGGVDRENPASARVLEKNGFRPRHGECASVEREWMFELKVHP